MVVDRSGIHRAHKLDTTLDHSQGQLRFHFFPAHCGHHLNPIEGCWRVMKDAIGAGRCFRDLSALYQRPARYSWPSRTAIRVHGEIRRGGSHTVRVWLALFMGRANRPLQCCSRGITDILPQANLNYFEAMALWSRADRFLCTSDANHIHGRLR